MNTYILTISHLSILLIGPIFFLGVINRTKAICAGRKGPKLYQTFFDFKRLLQKKPIYSSATSWIFQLGPSVILASTWLAGLLVPMIPGFSPMAFPWDFVVFAYLLGLGRLFLVLSALDTGSSFEGMGSSREMTFSSIVEPAFFIGVATMAALSGKSEFSALFHLSPTVSPVFYALCILMLFVLLQTEAARLPVDDPNTHLELTMVHEVMILDHSGPDLAAMTYATAIKMTMWLGLLAVMTNPFAPEIYGWASIGVSLLLMTLFAVGVGMVESVMARLRMSAVPYYAMLALGAGGTMFVLFIFKTFRS